MCGIAGFSLSKNSRVNARALAHSLLAEIEWRGNHASGFAFQQDGVAGVYKGPIPGSQLPLTDLPRKARTVVLHTRFSTQGSEKFNENNHPVLSPDGQVALVHNGVITNDAQLRKELPTGLPEVDTAVIPAILSMADVRDFKYLSELGGYAAIAWLDDRDQDMLNVARLESSPVAYTWLQDGSFVFASTMQHLFDALDLLNLDHGAMFNMDEQVYYGVKNGIIQYASATPEMQDDYWSYRKYQSATSGGHTGTARNPIGNRATGYAASSALSQETIDAAEKLDEEWRQEGRAAVWDDIPPAGDRIDANWVQQELDNGWTKGADNVWRPNKRNTPEVKGNQGFYLVDHDDDIAYFPTLGELEEHLEWLNGLQGDLMFTSDPELKWTNHIKDMGHIDTMSGMESWFEDMAFIDDFEPSDGNLNHIREGIGMIGVTRGA